MQLTVRAVMRCAFPALQKSQGLLNLLENFSEKIERTFGSAMEQLSTLRRIRAAVIECDVTDDKVFSLPAIA